MSMPLARCAAIVLAAEADLNAQVAARDGLAAPVAWICVRLGCSPATLRRRLDEEGISLVAIKDARRCEWAISLLRQAPIEEVASPCRLRR